MRIDKERAYLLHRRSYSETSIIGYFFTLEHGIVHILVRGAKRKNSSYAILQPGMELLLSWSGKRDLKVMLNLEIKQRHDLYSGKQLTILFYVNELLLKLLKPFDPHTKLYDYYRSFLLSQGEAPAESNLRIFEQKLFAELGYGVSTDKDYKSGLRVQENKAYVYDPGCGFTLATSDNLQHSFQGMEVIKMREGDFADPKVCQATKRLSRLIIHHLLGERTLASRKLVFSKRG